MPLSFINHHTSLTLHYLAMKYYKLAWSPWGKRSLIRSGAAILDYRFTHLKILGLDIIRSGKIMSDN